MISLGTRQPNRNYQVCTLHPPEVPPLFEKHFNKAHRKLTKQTESLKHINTLMVKRDRLDEYLQGLQLSHRSHSQTLPAIQESFVQLTQRKESTYQHIIQRAEKLADRQRQQRLLREKQPTRLRRPELSDLPLLSEVAKNNDIDPNSIFKVIDATKERQATRLKVAHYYKYQLRWKDSIWQQLSK